MLAVRQCELNTAEPIRSATCTNTMAPLGDHNQCLDLKSFPLVFPSVWHVHTCPAWIIPRCVKPITVVSLCKQRKASGHNASLHFTSHRALLSNAQPYALLKIYSSLQISLIIYYLLLKCVLRSMLTLSPLKKQSCIGLQVTYR